MTWKYRADYNNNPPSPVAFIPDITSTSGRLHSEFVRLLFLQTHRETDRFFAASRKFSFAQSTSGGLKVEDSSTFAARRSFEPQVKKRKPTR